MDFSGDAGMIVDGEVCGVDNCTSHRWISNGDGTISCENGHVKAGYAASDEAPEMEFETQGRRTVKKREREKRETIIYKGQEQKNLYILCFQLILRKQLKFLIEMQSLPQELECIVRELWEQRMNRFADAIDNNLGETFSSFQQERVSKAHERHQLQLLPPLIETVGLCYMGIIILRLPIFMGDLLSWIKHGDLLYVGAGNQLPNDMLRRLHSVHHLHLNPPLVPDFDFLRSMISNIIGSYCRELGIKLPGLNVSSCLFRLVRMLCLPIEIYPAVKTLIGLIGTIFDSLGLSARRGLRTNALRDQKLAAYLTLAVGLLYPFDEKPRIPKSRIEPSSATIDWFIWKEMHDRRHNSSQDDVVHLQCITLMDARNVSEKDLVVMDDEKIDQYLDWIADSVAKPREDKVLKKNDFAKDLFDLFPIERVPARKEDNLRHSSSSRRALEGDTENELELVQRGLVITEALSQDEELAAGSMILRPGANYRRFHAIQDLGSGSARTFYEAVAECIGVSLDILVEEVVSLDHQLFKWLRDERKVRS